MNPNKIEYMEAHVRLHAHTDPTNWPTPKLVACFSLLPLPLVPFEEWEARMGLTGVETPADKIEQAVEEHNSNVVGALPALLPPGAKVDKSE